MSNEEEAAPRAVYDCMMFLQGAARAVGPAAACLKLAEAGRVKLFISPRILAEIRDVLTRPKLQRKFPILMPDYVEEFLSTLLRFTTLVTEIPTAFHYKRDSKDEPYINLAIATNAQYLVSRDNDFLDLVNDTKPEGIEFRQRFPNLLILDPVAFLRTLPSAEETGLMTASS